MEKETQVQEKRYVGPKEIFLYGVANGGQVFGYNIVSMQLSFFFTMVFGIPSAAVAVMVFVLGIWDAFNDPIMGGLIDRTRTRYGKLRPWLLIVPIPLSITTILLFSGPVILQDVKTTAIKIVYMYISYIIWEFFYTIGDVPFWGLSAAISPSTRDRTNAITSARFISGIIGGLASPLLSVMIDLSNNGVIGWDLKEVFCFMGILAGAMILLLFSLAGTKCRERVVQSEERPNLFQSFANMFKNRPLLMIILSNVLGTVTRIADVFNTYFYIFVLDLASYSIIIGIPGTITGFLGYGLVPILKRKFSNRQIIALCTFSKAAISVIVFLIGMNYYDKAAVVVPLLMLQGAVNSLFTSVTMVVPTEMIGDTVDYMEWMTGKRNEGTNFAVLTFVSKLTGSLSTSLSAAILPLIGIIVPSDGTDPYLNGAGVNTSFWLWGLITAIPPVIGLVQLIPYIFYDLQGKKLEKIHSDMRIRREELAQSATARAGKEGEE